MKVLHLLFIILLTFFSILVVPGYEVYSGDQSVWIPSIMKAADQGLFANDLLFMHENTFNQYSIMDEVVVFLLQATPLDVETILFLLYLMTRFLLFLALFLITARISNEGVSKFLVPMLFVTPLWINGSAFTVNLSLEPRFVAFTLNMLGLYFLFSKRIFLSAVACASGLLFHPIISLPFTTFFYYKIIYLSCREKNMHYLPAALLPIIAYATIFGIGTGELLSAASYDEEWFNIVHFRAKRLFVTNWSLYSYVALLGIVMLFVFLFQNLKDKISDSFRKDFLTIGVICGVYFLASILFSDILHKTISNNVQLWRSVILFKTVTLVMFGIFVGKMWSTIKGLYPTMIVASFVALIINEALSWPFLFAFSFVFFKNKYIRKYRIAHVNDAVLLVGIALIGFLASILGANRKVTLILYLLAILTMSGILFFILLQKERAMFRNLLFLCMALVIIAAPLVRGFSYRDEYSQSSDFLGLKKWAMDNTNKTDVFIVDPRKDFGMRLGLHRNIFVNYEDGGLGVYSRTFALEWFARYKLLKNYPNLSREDVEKIKYVYDADYLIVREKIRLDFKKVFENRSFVVYKLS